MNLNKLKLLALLLPAMALSGCKEWKADQMLVENLWKETVKVTGLPAETPMPKVEFLQGLDPKGEGALGRCYYGDDKRLEIYLGEGIRSIWNYQDGKNGPGWNVSYGEGRALIYSTAAHEMLHYALFLRGVGNYRHHKAMQEFGYLEKLVDFISQHFQIHPDGFQKEIVLKRLAKGISNDEKSLAGH